MDLDNGLSQLEIGTSGTKQETNLCLNQWIHSFLTYKHDANKKKKTVNLDENSNLTHWGPMLPYGNMDLAQLLSR